MKKIATALTLAALFFVQPSGLRAQVQQPSAEYTATWDPVQGRWKDSVRTFQMSYSPEQTLTSRSGKYQTTYSGFIPVGTEVYQSRFFWDPTKTYSKAQVDSVHENGDLTPVRVDEYDRSVPRRTSYTRSVWNGSSWTPIQKSISMEDTLGVLRSIVNHALMSGELVITDSTHVDVTQDFKGNVTGIKISQWMIGEAKPEVIAEQRYTLAGDGSIAVAEVWDNASGELAKAYRLHSFDWAVRNKSFPYVNRESSLYLFYGGDGYRTVTVDLPSGDDWSEFYQAQQSFDAQERVVSYTFNGMTKDTFAFDQGLLTFNQYDEFFAGQWLTSRGTRTVYDRDANGTLRTVTTQRFDPNTSQYVNERLYYYVFGPASVSDQQAKTSIAAYPNPTTNELYIESDASITLIQIMDVTGAELMTATTAPVDVSRLAPGAYSVKVSTVAGQQNLRFIKSH